MTALSERSVDLEASAKGQTPHERVLGTRLGSARLPGVLDERLAGRDWVIGVDYSIADISLLGWVLSLIGFYGTRGLVGFNRFFMCGRGSTAASRIRRCGAGCK
jgi:glutathione S-transferase